LVVPPVVPISERTYACLERLVQRDHDRIAPEGRTMALLHGEVRPAAFVLFHGLAATPAQFTRFAHDLYARGHNVLVPRLPRHGYRDRLCDALSTLTSDQLRAVAAQSVDAAHGLGERVVVAGFSLGGVLAAYVAQRRRVARAVAIAPFFGLSWMPNRFMPHLARTLLAFPNLFAWWNPIARERYYPSHGYPRYATHAVAHAYLLAQQVMAAAPDGIAADELVLVTNAREAAVSNRAVRRFERALLSSGAARLEHVVLSGIPFSHDIIEPLRHPEIAGRVYPRLLALIEG
jgi:alpha-beta hydrolase superfamily lysophospholipase